VIAVIGDVHAKFRELAALVQALVAQWGSDLVILQVGDLGLWPAHLMESGHEFVAPPHPVYWCDGNHEYFPDLAGLTIPTEVRPNLIYCPRGTVLSLDGRQVGFLGGGHSIDAGRRVEGVSWFREERITYADVGRFGSIETVDLLVTHVPPRTVMRHVFGVSGDSSDQAVEQVWQGIGRPRLVCGHMHERRDIATGGGITVLEELGVVLV
jgi:hypothetical protein